MNKKNTDAESRSLILNDLDTNFLVEAAAGTGKTTSIVGRMVNLIATGSCRIESLAAVTFTRKAAAELRERFHARMRSEAATDRPADEIERLGEAINRIEYAFVGTFHSFCSLLLRERPIECGVDPGFRELDESEDGTIREHAWQMFLHDLYSKQDDRLDRIHELGLKTSDLKKCFNRFIEFPDVHDWPHASPAPIDVDAVKTTVRGYVEDMRAIAPSFPPNRETDKLMDRYEMIVRSTDNADWRVLGQFFDLLELFDTSPGATLKWWHDKKVAKQERDRFSDFRETVAKPNLDWWYRHRYEFVIELLQQARAIYDQLRRASGGLDFQDLLIRTAEALKSQPNLRAYFQRRFTNLLVDEFQDTDPIQAEILAYLTSENREEQNWQQCVPRRGSLFLVGDPKQSIYRFRRADIVTYKQVKEIFAKSGGSVLTLSKSFRSTSEIREWINPVFEDFFGSTETIYSPAAVEMEQGRESLNTGKLQGVQRLPIPEGLNQSDAVAYEADFIARYIHNAIAEGLTVARSQNELDRGKTKAIEAGDFLIVTRNKKHLHAYSEALDQLGINNEVTGSNAFQNIEELQIILDCLQAIDDPKNPVAYVNVLRGDLFGFGDSDLYELKRNGGWFSYSSPLPEGLSDPLRAQYEEVNVRLSKYQRWLRNKPFTAAFSNIASDLGLLARCGTHPDGDVVAGGFLKAIEWLRAQSWDFDSANDVIAFLEDLINNSETDTCSVMPKSGSCVRIMNLHKVKGLEAPVVFLANTFGAFKREPNFHVDRSQDITRGYLAITKPKGKWATQPMAIPSNWDHFKNEESEFEAAEETRLLYVACTRAACQLVISVASSRQERYSHWTPLHNQIASLPELIVPKSSKSVPKVRRPAPVATLSATAQQIEQSWHKLKVPTYNVVAAKSVAMKHSPARPTWQASGDYGHTWGSAIHRLLEVRMELPDLDLAPMTTRLVEQYDLGTARVEELLATVESVVASDIWSRAQSASSIYTEIPFETGSTGDSGIPTITRGVIDLCFEESDGWVIVDYKTDGIGEADLEAALDYYSPQLRSYAEFWQDITGQAVGELGVYFTKLLTYQTIDIQ